MTARLPSPPRPVAANGHAVRSAATRTRLFDATIDCLFRDGYAATTTVAVARRAGVSRGAMLHQFPTRADLILATAEHIVHDQDTRRRAALRDVPRGEPRFRGITAVAWETMKEPASIALLEIMLGARSDAELAMRFPSVMQAIEGTLVSGPIEVAHDTGISDDDTIEAMTLLHLAAMRGLAIERLLRPDNAAIDAAFDLLIWYKDRLIDRLKAQPG